MNEERCLRDAGKPARKGARGPRRKPMILQILLPTAIMAAVAQPAYAYLDPGTGSIIVQGIVAGVAATVAYAGIYWERVKSFVTSRFKPAKSEGAEGGAKQEDSSF